MSLESVRAFLAERAPELVIIDQSVSTATVAEAAAALGVSTGRIAKTLSVRAGDRVALIVARGDARLHNGKAKAALGAKPRMLAVEEVEALTGHPVGGVCPFGLANAMPIYCDQSLRDFDTIFPAAGARTASVELTPERLAEITDALWVDVCAPPIEES